MYQTLSVVSVGCIEGFSENNPRKVTPSTMEIVRGGAVKCILLPTLTRSKTPSFGKKRSKNDYVIKLFTVFIFSYFFVNIISNGASFERPSSSLHMMLLYMEILQ